MRQPRCCGVMVVGSDSLERRERGISSMDLWESCYIRMVFQDTYEVISFYFLYTYGLDFGYGKYYLTLLFRQERSMLFVAMIVMLS